MNCIIKTISVIMICISLLALVSCDDIYKTIEITDTSSYAEIWDLPERRVFDNMNNLLIFPDDVSNLNVKSLYCWNATYKWTGTGYQIHLSVYYDRQAYDVEVARLSEIVCVEPIRKDDENFLLPAYVAVWNWKGCFEYALIDDTNQTIHYIYLQLVNSNDVKLDESILPIEYDSIVSSDDNQTDYFSIYEN